MFNSVEETRVEETDGVSYQSSGLLSNLLPEEFEISTNVKVLK